MDRMDTMGLFVQAVETGSLSGAARKSGLSLSSVSRHLSALEERLRSRLLVRTTRALVLTDVGRVYYENAKRLLAEIDDVEASLNVVASAPAGTLRVAGPTLFGRVFMQPLLASFAVRYPAVSLDVLLLDREISLLDEGVDVAVRIGSLEDSSLIARKLGELRWIVCAAPGYLAANGSPKALSDLENHACLAYAPQGGPPEWAFMEHGKPSLIRVKPRMRANTIDGVIAAAVEGAGLVSTPAWAVAKYVQEGKLQRVLAPYETAPRPIHAVFTHTRFLSAKTRLLIDYLAEEIGRINFDLIVP